MNLSLRSFHYYYTITSSFSMPTHHLFPSLSLPFPSLNVSHSHSLSSRCARSESTQQVSLYNETIDEEFIDGDDGFDYDEEEYDEEAETQVGDGEAGGGISLVGTWWDKTALEIAQDVSLHFDGRLGIYAFKTFSHSAIRVHIEDISKKSGSPGMEDIEAFTVAYRARLDEAELAKSIPENIILEVSSPGVERVIRIPQDLDRFKERAMYVKYMNQVNEDESSPEEGENDGIFTLVSFDTESKCCTWGLANVRVNREKAGKGRPLNKKQREWRLNTPFEALRLVRLYSDI